MAAITHVPILDLETRRKKESIGFPVRMVEWGHALGAGVASIKPPR
jgi:hypothetical protein